MPIFQMAFEFEPSSLSVGTLNGIVFSILRDGNWVMPWEICDRILRSHHVRVSDSSVTARLRDLRKDRYGKHVIELRRRTGSRGYEYRLATPGVIEPPQQMKFSDQVPDIEIK